MIKEAIVKIVGKGDLTYDEAYTVMDEIMSGQTTATQNAAFLAALSTKSAGVETADEISGCAAAMREHALAVPHPGLRIRELKPAAPVPENFRARSADPARAPRLRVATYNLEHFTDARFDGPLRTPAAFRNGHGRI